MTVDWRQTRRPAISFAVFGALAFIAGAQVPLLWRIVLVASAAASILASSVEPGPAVRPVELHRIPNQPTGT